MLCMKKEVNGRNKNNSINLFRLQKTKFKYVNINIHPKKESIIKQSY